MILDKTAKNLAQNTTALRKKRKLTQAALAQSMGAARSLIALMESGSANPTLEVLLKLSQALQVSIDELIGSPRAECHHIRAHEIPLDARSKNGILLRKLLPEKIYATEIDEISLDPKAAMTGSPHVEGTKEYFTCIKGKIQVAVLGQTYLLQKGDVLAFPGDKPHSYKNLSQQHSKGISVVLLNPTL